MINALVRLVKIPSRLAVASIAISFASALALAAHAQTTEIPAQQEKSGDSARTPSMQENNSDSTLEIAPQTGYKPQKPSTQVVPSNRDFKPGEDTSSIDRNFRPDESGEGGGSRGEHRAPYLGLSVETAIKCYKGFEEYSLEVVSVDRNSPAARAGLRARTDSGGAVAAASTLAGMLGPVGSLAASAAMTHSCAGEGNGDLIVGIDDQRIHNQNDMQAMMSRMKPGDTIYLNVVRPTGGCNHQSLRIPVTLGDSANPFASAGR